MINKRLLVKALLAHNDENSFYDKKLKISLGSKEGKGKFLKHICALSNSNPKNNAYIVIGVEDKNNKIVGVDFFDDSKIQNLINAYLTHPPFVLYENIPFPHLPEGKVVGLVTIRPTDKVTSLKKNIWKYYGGNVFYREGSMSVPQVFDMKINHENPRIVKRIEKHAQNNIQLTLEGVLDFMDKHKGDLTTQYKVFKESFVVCWSGLKKQGKKRTYFSRVDIELINEQVKLFYSALDEVEISYTEKEFIITEYIQLGLQQEIKFYPLEEVRIAFLDNGNYSLSSHLLFIPPQWDKKILLHLMNTSTFILQKLRGNATLTKSEHQEIPRICSYLMICILNDIPKAKTEFEAAKPLFKNLGEALYQTYKDAQRVLRKVKYN